MNAFTLRQFEYLVAAADGGSLRSAALRCNATESSVSTAMSALEAALDAQLLIRRRAHGVSLTPIGDQVVGIARRMLDLADDVKGAVDAELGVVSGPLVIACLTSFSAQLLPLIAEDFAEHFPQIRLQFVEGLAPDIQDMLRTGEADVAVMFAFQMEPGIDHVHVAHVEPRAMLPSGHTLAGREVVSLADLRATPLISLSKRASTGILEVLMGELHIEQSSSWKFSSPETVRAMVRAGFGYSVTIDGPPSLVVPDPGIHYARIAEPIPSTSIALARLRGAASNARVRVLREFLERMLARDDGGAASGNHEEESH